MDKNTVDFIEFLAIILLIAAFVLTVTILSTFALAQEHKGVVIEFPISTNVMNCTTDPWLCEGRFMMTNNGPIIWTSKPGSIAEDGAETPPATTDLNAIEPAAGNAAIDLVFE